MNTKKLLIVAAMLGSALAVLGLALKSPEDEAAAGDLPTTRATMETLTVTATAIGTLELEVGAEVKVGSRLSGVVAALEVGVGDEVRRGDLLAVLDDAEWRTRVAALEAELAEATARLGYARLESRALEGIDVTTPIERAAARKDVAVLEAEIERIRARLAEAEIELGYTRIVAPVSGTIASVSTYEGETVAASFAAPTFVTIVDLNRLEVRAYVDETDIGRVAPGRPATFRVDAYPGRDIEGVVAAIYPKAELVNNVVNYVAIIAIVDDDPPLLRPEMTARVSLVLDRRESALTVPRSALLREGEKNAVVVRAAGGWRVVPVETGLFTTRRIEITGGLGAGTEVLTDAERWHEMQMEDTR